MKKPTFKSYVVARKGMWEGRYSIVQWHAVTGDVDEAHDIAAIESGRTGEEYGVWHCDIVLNKRVRPPQPAESGKPEGA